MSNKRKGESPEDIRPRVGGARKKQSERYVELENGIVTKFYESCEQPT